MTELVSNVEAILSQVKQADIPQTVADLRRLIKNTDTAITALNTKELQSKVEG